MSKFGRIISSVVIAGIVILAVWYMIKSANPTPQTVTKDGGEQIPATAKPTTGVTADSSLDADMAAIDAEITTIDQNSATVDEGLNDKPVSQTE